MHNIPAIEDQNTEFKVSFNTGVIESLVAFANAGGGTVYVGVDDSGKLLGIQLAKESVQNFVNEIKSKTAPVLIPDVNVIDVDGKQIVAFQIQEYPIKPVAVQGRYYKRVNNSNHQLTVGEVVNLYLHTINSSWDTYVDALHTIDDISLEKVQKAIDLLENKGHSITEDPLSFLLKYNMLREDKITNAAFLLFHKDDNIISTVELGRFQTDIIIKDSARSKSDVLTQINEVLDFVRKHINKEIIITGSAYNTERWQYPLEAIREIVLNMIIHRDYRSASDSIVKVYDNKIEFFNPGMLPDDITVDDLMNNRYKSTPRNKMVADFCKDLGLIEKYGSGIRRVITLFKEVGLPLPKFEQISGGLNVTVYSKNFEGGDSDKVIGRVGDRVGDKVGDRVGDKLSETQKRILNLMQQNPSVSAQSLSEEIGISKRKIEENIRTLRERSKIVRVGNAKSGHWEVLD